MRQEELGYPQVPLSAQVWAAIGGTGQGCDSLACSPEGATSGSCSEVTRQRDWSQRPSQGSCTVRAGEEAGGCRGANQTPKKGRRSKTGFHPVIDKSLTG